MRMDSNAFLPFACHTVKAYAPDCAVWEEARKRGTPVEVGRSRSFRPESPRYFFLVERGRFKSVFTTRQGKQRQLLIYESGAVLNVPCAVLNSKTDIDYFALENGLLWKLSIDLVTGEKIECPHLARACLYCLSSVIETYYAGLTWLDVDDFKKVFCRYLVFAMRNANSEEFCPGMTQEECASMLGVHRATLSRAIRELKNLGIIGCFTSAKVSILDRERLARLADF